MTEEEKEEKKIRDKWGGTLAESVPISDLKMLNSKGYIPRSQATCFRCGEKGHYIQHCPTNDDPDFDQVRGYSLCLLRSLSSSHSLSHLFT